MATTKATLLGHRSATSFSDLTLSGDLTVNGTTTTLDTAVQNVDKLEIGASTTDYGAKINQASTGNILQLQDGGTDVMVVKDGGNVGIGTASPSCALHVHTDNSASTNYLAQRWGNSTTTHGYVDFQLVNPGSTASGFPRLDLEIGNSPIMSFVRGGNVGIGTTAPGLSGTATHKYLTILNTEATDSVDRPAILELACNNKGNGVHIGKIDFWSDVDGGNDHVGAIICAQQGTTTNNVGGKFRFQTKADNGSLSDSMVISEGGNVGIGNTSPSTRLDVQNGSFDGQIIARSTANSYQQRFIACYAGTTSNIGSIRRVGSGSSLEFVSGSDRRIKKDIISTSDVLDKLLKIKIYDFKFKENDELGNGPIAQELIEHFPELVGKTDDGLGEELPEGVESWTVGSHMNWILTKAIQELSAKVTTLENA